MPSFCVFALSYHQTFTATLELVSIIISTFQTRKFGSEKLGNLPRVSQLVGDKASGLANPRLSDGRMEPLSSTFFFFLIAKNSFDIKSWCSK